MSRREAFLLRVDPKVLGAVRRWARDDLRSVNAQIEFVLRRALRAEGRWSSAGGDDQRGTKLRSAGSERDLTTADGDLPRQGGR